MEGFPSPPSVKVVDRIKELKILRWESKLTRSLQCILEYESGAIDADVEEILEPLTSIWIKMWSH